jgi:hypothetical protein
MLSMEKVGELVRRPAQSFAAVIQHPKHYGLSMQRRVGAGVAQNGNTSHLNSTPRLKRPRGGAQVRKYDSAGEAQWEAIVYSIWDFAGQELFYTLHHLFLTRQGVYLVVRPAHSTLFFPRPAPPPTSHGTSFVSTAGSLTERVTVQAHGCHHADHGTCTHSPTRSRARSHQC